MNQGRITVEIYDDHAGAFRWRALRGGNIVATSGEGDGYTTRKDCTRAFKSFAGALPGARIIQVPEQRPEG